VSGAADESFTADDIAWASDPVVMPAPRDCALSERHGVSELVIEQLTHDVLDRNDTISALVELVADLAFDNVVARRLAKDERRQRVYSDGQLHRHRRVLNGQRRQDSAPPQARLMPPHVAAVSVRGALIQVTR
jgi:hypothetical protein